jgi:hypothetical protein
VYGQTSRCFFTRAFYAALAAGDAPDVALSKGRSAIRVGDPARGGGARLLERDWILPVLTLAVPPEQCCPAHSTSTS